MIQIPLSRRETKPDYLIKDFLPVPKWTKDKVLYEVNVRQYSPEGNFKAVEKDLQRLKNMGIDILWFMPIHPIGKEKRKGSLGSYYSIADYQKVNPEFGTLQDFKDLVRKAHSMGMYVMIDFVANHSSWDNWLMEKHPEYYTKKDGKIVSPVDDWSDVADLNFDEEGLQSYLIESLKYWVKTCNIDGYRCDVAGMVPDSFWKKAKHELDQIKSIFFLAEAEGKNFHEAGFHMTYAWEFHHLLNKIAKNEINVPELSSYFRKSNAQYGRADYRLNFTSNHDENSWNGTVFDRMGKAHKCLAALTFFSPGMPLIYSGQEAPLYKKLKFFDRDPINWNNYAYQEFYADLIKLKKSNPALWNGVYGGNFKLVPTTNGKDILGIYRKNGANEIAAFFNLSNNMITFEVKAPDLPYLNSFKRYTLDPWEYKILNQDVN